jgi:NAD(P)-dependent dehydrogenase (short-subunit alcohol dehydrogenase family)
VGTNDRRVVVIGGTSGIGFAIAEAAAGAGASVSVASSSAENVASALDRLPRGVEGFRLDVTSETGMQAFFKEVGEFDHLAYTAGDYLLFKPIHDITMNEARGSFSVRYWGAFMAVKYGMASIRPAGSFVLTSGIVSVRPPASLAAPASAVGAVETLARALAVELAPVRVNAVRLGPVGRKPQPGEEEHQRVLYQAVSDRLPGKRMGLASEAAAAYLYLMDNGFSTGTILTTDGGYTLV